MKVDIITLVNGAIFKDKFFNELKAFSDCLSLKLTQKVLLAAITEMKLPVLMIRRHALINNPGKILHCSLPSCHSTAVDSGRECSRRYSKQ